jgi:hypothetical protein
MIYKLQAQSGFRRDSMWCGPAAHAVMPSPAERNERGACTFFGGVPIGRAPYGVSSASKCELITRLHLAAVIEGRPGDIPARSDLSRSSTLSGSVSTRPARPSPSISDVFGGRRDGRCMSILDSRKPHAEKVSAHRPRQNYRCAPRSVRHHERPLPWKASRLRDPSAGFWQDVPEGHRSGGSEHRQGTLTIIGWQCASGH